MRRVMIQARERRVSKKAVSACHHASSFSRRAARRFAAVLGVPAHELEPRFPRGQRRRADVDPEHRPEPVILA